MTTRSMTLEEAGMAVTDPSAFADEDRLHAAFALLRAHDPIHRVEAESFPPFWLVTRHADVMEVESQPELFHNAPQPVLATHEAIERTANMGELLRTLIHMDAPDHPKYRGLTAEWFLPKSLNRLNDRLAELARQSVARMEELGGRCDFARDIAMRFPLNVILSILGLPESDYDRMLTLTQELFGAADPDVARGQSLEDQMGVIADFAQYFAALIAERRAHPNEDLASRIANSEIDGRPLADLEAISYFVIIATAGHDTTSSAMAGGLHALVEHPGELDRLRADPALIPTAVDEMIRWVTPVKHFMRTATADATVGGHPIKRGDWLMLSYVSANRDEAVFDQPFRFDVGRRPNKHVAFGFGVHFCLGAQLARNELRALFSELVPRLEHIELDGQAALTRTLFVGGLKSLPVRYRLA